MMNDDSQYYDFGHSVDLREYFEKRWIVALLRGLNMVEHHTNAYDYKG